MHWLVTTHATRSTFRVHTFALTVIVSWLLVGCSEEKGLSRFDISGNVTFEGQAIPAGTIQFLPDSKQGNRGPTGYAVIENGKYDTSLAGRGPIGGPHIVEITGFDGQSNPAAEMEKGRPLFNGYQTNVELPKEPTSLDFDVTTEE